MRISDWSSDVCSSDLLFDQRRRDHTAIAQHGEELALSHAVLLRDLLQRAGDLDVGDLDIETLGLLHLEALVDRKSVVSGKSGAVGVVLGGRRFVKKKKKRWNRVDA